MSLQTLIGILRARWATVTASALFCAAIALGAFFIIPTSYTAKTTLYVSAQGGDTPQQAFQGAQLSEQRVRSYTDLATGDRVLNSVIKELGLALTTQQLEKKVSATSNLQSVLIDVRATDADPLVSAQIANAVAMQACAVVAELEKPRDPLAVPAVELRVVQPAQAPTDPSSPGWPIVTICGTLAGLIFGVGFAIIRSRLDRSVGSAEQLAGAASIANLASIPIDAAFNDVRVVVQGQPYGVVAEAFRQLRTNLQFVDIDKPNKVLLVTSSQSGEGKSTTVANLASALSAAGKRVLIIEADLRRPRQASLLGLDASVGLTQIFSERLAARDVTQQWGGGVFDVILAGHIPPNPSELLGSQHMQLLLDDARRRYDYVLVDCPPVLPVTDTIALSPATDGVLFVCRLGVTTVPQVAASMSALRAASANVVGTVATFTPQREIQRYGEYGSYRPRSKTLAPAPRSRLSHDQSTARLQPADGHDADHRADRSR